MIEEGEAGSPCWRSGERLEGTSFLWRRDLSHQGRNDFPKVSRLNGSTSGTRTRSLTPRVVVCTFLQPLMMSVA